MSKVFVVQRQQRWDAAAGEMVDRFDYEPAAEFGDLVYCLGHRDNPMQGDLVVRKLETVLKDMNPEEDYLLPVGNPCLIGAATAVAGRLHGKVRLLQWDKRYQAYDTIVLPFQA